MELKRSKELIGKFGGQRILVVGDVVLDHYVHGSVERLNPEAPVPILVARDEYERTGGAGNVAKNLAGLGVEATLLSVVGDDGAATGIEAAAQAEGYRPVLVRDGERPTIRKIRHIVDTKVDGQQLLRVDYEKTHNIAGEVEERFLQRLEEEIERGVSGIIVSDYAKGVVTRRVAERLLDLAGQRDVLVAADVKPSRAQYFTGATLVSPNVKEAHEYVGLNPHEDHVAVEELAKMVSMKVCADVYLTLGREGMYVYCGGAGGDHISQDVHAVDPSGAGDTVIAALLAALLAGASELEAATLANAAGGVVVQKIGSVGLTADELTEEMRRTTEVMADVEQDTGQA